MNALLDFLHSLHSLHSAEGLRHIVQSGGLFVLAGIIFAETGLLVGFFLPGDSLLVTAGIFAATDGNGGAGLFSLGALIGLLSVASVVGDQLGYYLGRRAGSLVFSRPDSFFFKKKHFEAAHEFYEKRGGRAIILAHFVPIFRTFVPFSAGVANMRYSHFVRFNVIGALSWIWSMLLIGYFLGQSPWADQLHKIILIVVFVSIIPILVQFAKRFFARFQQRQT